jgi:hypothetical protein
MRCDEWGRPTDVPTSMFGDDILFLGVIYQMMGSCQSSNPGHVYSILGGERETVKAAVLGGPGHGGGGGGKRPVLGVHVRNNPSGKRGGVRRGARSH